VSQFRLVLDIAWNWGSEGLELKEKYYILQELVGHEWQTCPVVMWNELSAKEVLEAKKALSRTGAYAPSATCKHGVHPYDCKQGCDPYDLPP
jgi:hypothetical protein